MLLEWLMINLIAGTHCAASEDRGSAVSRFFGDFHRNCALAPDIKLDVSGVLDIDQNERIFWNGGFEALGQMTFTTRFQYEAVTDQFLALNMKAIDEGPASSNVCAGQLETDVHFPILDEKTWLLSEPKINDGGLKFYEGGVAFLGGISCASGFPECEENKAEAQNADRHPDYSSNPHSSRPNRHGLLSFQVASLLLGILGFMLNALITFRSRNVGDGTFELHAFASGCCLILCIPFGCDLMLSLL